MKNFYHSSHFSGLHRPRPEPVMRKFGWTLVTHGAAFAAGALMVVWVLRGLPW